MSTYNNFIIGQTNIVTVNELLSKAYQIDERNRLIDYKWVEEIVESQKNYYETYGHFHYPENFLFYYEKSTKKLFLYDGQHRKRSLELLSYDINYKEHILKYLVSFHVEEVENLDHISKIFQFANKRLIENSSIYMKENIENMEEFKKKYNDELFFKKIVNETITSLESIYPNLFYLNLQSSGEPSNVLPKISKDKFVNVLRNLPNILDLNSNIIIKKLCECNEECKKYMNKSKNGMVKKRLEKINSYDNNFYLGYYHYFLYKKSDSLATKYANCKWLTCIKFNN